MMRRYSSVTRAHQISKGHCIRTFFSTIPTYQSRVLEPSATTDGADVVPSDCGNSSPDNNKWLPQLAESHVVNLSIQTTATSDGLVPTNHPGLVEPQDSWSTRPTIRASVSSDTSDPESPFLVTMESSATLTPPRPSPQTDTIPADSSSFVAVRKEAAEFIESLRQNEPSVIDPNTKTATPLTSDYVVRRLDNFVERVSGSEKSLASLSSPDERNLVSLSSPNEVSAPKSQPLLSGAAPESPVPPRFGWMKDISLSSLLSRSPSSYGDMCALAQGLDGTVITTPLPKPEASAGPLSSASSELEAVKAELAALKEKSEADTSKWSHVESTAAAEHRSVQDHLNAKLRRFKKMHRAYEAFMGERLAKLETSAWHSNRKIRGLQAKLGASQNEVEFHTKDGIKLQAEKETLQRMVKENRALAIKMGKLVRKEQSDARVSVAKEREVTRHLVDKTEKRHKQELLAAEEEKQKAVQRAKAQLTSVQKTLIDLVGIVNAPSDAAPTK